VNSRPSRRVVTPGRVVVLGALAGAAVGTRSMLRSAREGWARYHAAPRTVEGPAAAGAAGRDGGEPGLGVTHPRQIPPRGWLGLLRRSWTAQGEHNTALLAAGVTYYSFLSIFPALIAIVAVYGLVASPAEVTRQVNSVAEQLPAEARKLISDQLQNVASAQAGALSVSLAVAVLTALWSASAAINGLMGALNVVYAEREDRGIVVKRGTSVLLTLGAVVFVVLAAFLLTVLPPLVGLLDLGPVGEWLLLGARWIGLLAAFMLGLGVLYHFGPDRADARFRWLGPGAVMSTALWILVSVGFSVYVANFGSYDKTYGTLAGVVVLLLWLFFTAYAVLLGAEVNAQAELSTAADTTTGAEQPLGERGAYVADHVVGAPGTASAGR
jgi:membrane protein